VLDEICAFLGVQPGIISEIPRENVTAHPERSVAHSALSRALRGIEAAEHEHAAEEGYRERHHEPERAGRDRPFRSQCRG